MLLTNAPAPLRSRRFDVFLAGGTTGCPNWQHDVIAALEGTNLSIVSPRRDLAIARTGNDALAQIEWERDALGRCRTIVFWFPAETLAPIALFELGGALERARRGKINLVIGADPGYERRFDVEQQAIVHGHTGTIETSLAAVIARLASPEERRRRFLFSPSALIE